MKKRFTLLSTALLMGTSLSVFAQEQASSVDKAEWKEGNYYQLQSDMIQNQVWTKLSLGNQPNLGMRALELFSAVRPCLAEQQKIVDCLSSLDEVIEKQKETLVAWEELKKGLLQQMFV